MNYTTYLEKKLAELEDHIEWEGPYHLKKARTFLTTTIQESILLGLEMAEGAVTESKEQHGSKGEITSWILGRIAELKKSVTTQS